MEGDTSGARPREDRHARRVLVVDDDPALLSVLARAFARAGYRVEMAANGRKALERVASFRPHLVVTDIVMPEMEGIGAILAIKQAPDPPKVIAMSGTGIAGRRNYLKWAKHLGADEVIAKPFALEDMLALTRRLVGAAPIQLIKLGS